MDSKHRIRSVVQADQQEGVRLPEVGQAAEQEYAEYVDDRRSLRHERKGEASQLRACSGYVVKRCYARLGVGWCGGSGGEVR